MAAQHIAEAHGYAGHVCAAGEGLDQHFTQALGTAHDIGGVDGLIGGELDKTLHTVLCRRGQQILGAEHIVLDGLGRADLHKRHMLVGRSMKDNGRMVGVKHLIQTGFVADRADQCDDGSLRAVLVFQLCLKLVGTVFIDVEDQQPARLVAHDLAAKFAADGAAAARDQHDLVMQILRDLCIVQLDLIAGEKVGRVQFTEACCDRVAVLIDSLRVAEHPHTAVSGVAEVDDLAEAVALDGGDGNDDLEDMIFAHKLRYVRDRAAHWHALHAQTLFGQVIVHQADRVAEALVFVFAEVDRPCTGIASADDQQRRIILRLVGLGILHGAKQTPQEAHACDCRRIEHRAKDQHGAGDRAVVVDEVKQHDHAGSQT